MPDKPLPEVAAFQLFLSGRVWVFGDMVTSRGILRPPEMNSVGLSNRARFAGR